MGKAQQGRPLWFGILVVVVFFVCVTLAFAWLGAGGPDAPHPVDGDYASCVTCHPTDPLPQGHQGRAADSCRSCHSG
jgi:hypothetical protein